MLRHKAETGADLVLLSAEVEVPGHRGARRRGPASRASSRPPTPRPAELAIAERNTGVYLLGAELLWKTLAQVDDQNRQGEIYLTEHRRDRRARGPRRRGAPDPGRRGGDRRQHSGPSSRARRRSCARRKLNQLMLAGVSIVDPSATWIDVDVEIGRDTVIEPGCVIQGASRHRRAGAPEARLHDRVERDRGRRRDRPQRPPAARHAPRTRRPDRQLRRGEEQRARRRREGRPSLLHRRRRRRRRRELRLRLDRRELRRHRQAPHAGRTARLHRLQREPGRAAAHRRGRLRGGGFDHHQGRPRASRSAVARAKQKNIEGWVGAPPRGRAGRSRKPGKARRKQRSR